MINQDERYLDLPQSEWLESGASLTYDSVVQNLDPDLDLGEQARFVPGGAGLFVFGRDEDGTIVERGTFAWEFDGGACAGTELEGETLGWIAFVSLSARRKTRRRARVGFFLRVALLARGAASSARGSVGV